MSAQLLAHAKHSFVGTAAGHSGAPWSQASRSGKCGDASAVGRFQARREASEVEPMGSTVLDWADDDLERLEIRTGHRAAGNGNRVAAHTVQTILVEVVVQKQTRWMRESWPNFSELGCCDRFTTGMKRPGT
jgi:hypothetical protein